MAQFVAIGGVYVNADNVEYIEPFERDFDTSPKCRIHFVSGKTKYIDNISAQAVRDRLDRKE